jgi:predicted amidohydrolase YtcJ
LKRVDVHAAWISERALELTKEALGGSLPAVVEGGEIVRDERGEATGMLFATLKDFFTKLSRNLHRQRYGPCAYATVDGVADDELLP